MAKKRVHEIAKERGISSKEVLAVLQKAGLDVKASASSVDENDIAMAFNGGKEQPAERGDRGGPVRPASDPGVARPGQSQPPSGQRRRSPSRRQAADRAVAATAPAAHPRRARRPRLERPPPARGDRLPGLAPAVRPGAAAAGATARSRPPSPHAVG